MPVAVMSAMQVIPEECLAIVFFVSCVASAARVEGDISTCTYVYIYMYIYRERERERDVSKYNQLFSPAAPCAAVKATCNIIASLTPVQIGGSRITPKRLRASEPSR